jgi:hypothetical protein
VVAKKEIPFEALEGDAEGDGMESETDGEPEEE